LLQLRLSHFRHSRNSFSLANPKPGSMRGFASYVDFRFVLAWPHLVNYWACDHPRFDCGEPTPTSHSLVRHAIPMAFISGEKGKGKINKVSDMRRHTLAKLVEWTGARRSSPFSDDKVADLWGLGDPVHGSTSNSCLATGRQHGLNKAVRKKGIAPQAGACAPRWDGPLIVNVKLQLKTDFLQFRSS